MKKTLALIRHAKAGLHTFSQKDFDRALNERGEKDAPMMGERLKQLELYPDIIIASSARRTKQTAQKIADVLSYDPNNIKLYERLYHCTPQVFEEVIAEQKDQLKTIFIIAHNPGITDFANQLSDTFRIDNMPTCSVVAATAHAARWADFMDETKEVFLFESPKKLYDNQ